MVKSDWQCISIFHHLFVNLCSIALSLLALNLVRHSVTTAVVAWFPNPLCLCADRAPGQTEQFGRGESAGWSERGLHFRRRLHLSTTVVVAATALRLAQASTI